MKFSNQPPVWKNEGVEPSQDIQEEGFRAGYKPPASYFNWFWARVGRCLTELQQKLGGVSDGANKTGASGTNGNIQVDGAEVPVYRHPTGEGSAHLPAGGGAGQTLQRTASGYGWGIPVPTSVEPFLKDAPAETTVADGDTLPFTDVSDGSRTKKITWAGLKTLLNAWAGALFAAKSHSHPQSQVTGLETALSSKETPAGAQSKADAAKTAAISTAATDATTKANKAEANAKAASVPIGRKVNGKALSGDITLGAGDVGAVPTGRKVNGKALSADITLSPSDVGAATASHGTHVSYSTTAPVMDGTAAAGSAATVARSDHKHPTDTSRAAASHTHTPVQAGLGNVPNVKTNDQVPTFTAATTRANLTSGEKLTVMLGKLAKWYADLKPVAWTGSYNDLTNKPAIPTVPGTLPPSGTAGGDLSGSYPNPTVKDDSHAHTLLSVKPDNFKDGAALPSTYPRGHCVFFSNAPANNKFNGVQYCTVVTIKGYSNMACVQYIYPYNVDAPIAYRYAIYNSDTWKPWRTLSIDGHAHAWGSITGKPTTFTPADHKHGAGDITSGTLSAARGGTGYTTLQATRNAMGLGNTTGAVPIANGGTGATTAAAALAALGGATSGHTHPPPANAGAHNAIYRGKNLGTSVTPAQYAAIKAGTFDDLFIGDYWTIGGVTYRIAAFDYYLNCGETNYTTHHAVIVPDTNLYSHVMNDTNITTGGYVGSKMYTEGLNQAKTTIKTAFNGHVLKHRIYLVNAVTDGHPSANAWCDSEVDLMNEQMVYGGAIFMPIANGSAVYANYRVEKSQLPLFALDPSRICNLAWYWLRDVVTASHFALVGGDGGAYCYGAGTSCGVRPAFSIS